MVACYRVLLFAVMWWYEVTHRNRYTYWNYALGTGFYFLLAGAHFFKITYLVDILTRFALPAVYGSAVLVFLFIGIILELNGGWLLLEGTDLGGGTVTVGTAYSADKIIHALPVVDLGLLLLSGYAQVTRRSVFRLCLLDHDCRHVQFAPIWCAKALCASSGSVSQDLLIDATSDICTITGVDCRRPPIFRGDGDGCEGIPRKRRKHLVVYYKLYCYVVPLLLAIFYTIFYDPFYEYPTGVEPWKLGLIGLFLWWTVMHFYVEAVTCPDETTVYMPEQ